MLAIVIFGLSLLLSSSVLAAVPNAHLPHLLDSRDTNCGEVVTVSNLTWHNSTHNLDCAGAGPDPGNNTTCIDGTCGIFICDTGLPVQPAGYGPPDTFSCDISSIGECYQSNPGSVPLRTIGDNYIRCGNSAPTLFFEGSSNGDGPREARVVVQITKICGANNDIITIQGEKKFQLTCSHDKDYNATCTADAFSVTLVTQSS